jgi:hypothetical protein
MQGTLSIVSLHGYPVTFSESGLPPGTPWWVNLTNGESFESAGNSTTFGEPNGSYHYALSADNGTYASPGGSFQVAGNAVSEQVVFSPVTYPVTFTESELPAGTEWWVNVTGFPSESSTSDTIVMNLMNGTYHLTATAGPDYLQWPPFQLPVNGRPTGLSIPFPPVEFVVTFTLGGPSLPYNAPWWLNLSDGQSLRSYSTTLPLLEKNGTYAWTMASSDKRYAPTEARGQFTVRGQPVNVTVNLTIVKYSVIFVETGLPSGANWTIILEGWTQSSTASKITFAEPNGSYIVSLIPPGGFNVGPFTTLLNVSGKNITQTIEFSRVPFSFLGLTEAQWGWTALVLVLVAVAAILVILYRKKSGRGGVGPPAAEKPSP